MEPRHITNFGIVKKSILLIVILYSGVMISCSTGSKTTTSTSGSSAMWYSKANSVSTTDSSFVAVAQGEAADSVRSHEMAMTAVRGLLDYHIQQQLDQAVNQTSDSKSLKSASFTKALRLIHFGDANMSVAKTHVQKEGKVYVTYVLADLPKKKVKSILWKELKRYHSQLAAMRNAPAFTALLEAPSMSDK